ncbi:MAG: glutamate racemase [Candidatus Zixiibacteriota bacterium]
MLNCKNTRGIKSDAPIGIFDSGVGGLTVVRAFERFLPNENLIYFGDTARYPYGPRSPEIVTEFAKQNAELLLTHGIKMLVVACNTASSVAMDVLEDFVDIPLIGVIEPGAAASVEASINHKIGVIGTAGTIESNSYQRSIRNLQKDAEIYAKQCPLFVALAQEGFTGRIADQVGEVYLAEIREKGIDTLILGCTHYPLITGSIQRVMGDGVKLIDSAESTVLKIRDYLNATGLENKCQDAGKIIYTVSDAPKNFKQVGQRFLKHEIGEVRFIRLR